MISVGNKILIPKKGINLKEDLISVWEFNETSGTTAEDSHGSNDGTIDGATINQAGKIDKAYDLNGAGDHINMGNDDSLRLTTSGSLFAWVKIDVLKQGDGIAGIYNTGDNKRSYFLFVNDNDDTVGVFLSDDGTFNAGHVKYYHATKSLFNDNDWHYVGFTWDNGTLNLYVDGDVDNFDKTDDPAFTSLYSSDEDFRVGARSNSGVIEKTMDGLVDQVATWNRALTSDEVSELYNSGDGKAYSEW